MAPRGIGDEQQKRAVGGVGELEPLESHQEHRPNEHKDEGDCIRAGACDQPKDMFEGTRQYSILRHGEPEQAGCAHKEETQSDDIAGTA